jgi:hypothetical protein
MKKLQYRIKQVYGNDMMYPANDVAEIIVRLTGKKTLDENALKQAAQLGFESERVF